MAGKLGRPPGSRLPLIRRVRFDRGLLDANGNFSLDGTEFRPQPIHGGRIGAQYRVTVHHSSNRQVAQLKDKGRVGDAWERSLEHSSRIRVVEYGP
jgi:hypothetical protein